MFTLPGKCARRYCDGLSRREFLKIGAYGGGLSYNGGLRLKNHVYSNNTGKKSAQTRSAATTTCAAGPEVIGANDGGGDSGGGDGGGDGGGEDDPPRRTPSGGGPFDWLSWLFTLLLLLLLLVLRSFVRSFSAAGAWCIQRLRNACARTPDLIETIRLFRVVFPRAIRDKVYIPETNDLVTDIVRARSCEWDVGPLRRFWEGFWRWIRFGFIVFRCFLAWAGEVRKCLSFEDDEQE